MRTVWAAKIKSKVAKGRESSIYSKVCDLPTNKCLRARKAKKLARNTYTHIIYEMAAPLRHGDQRPILNGTTFVGAFTCLSLSFFLCLCRCDFTRRLAKASERNRKSYLAHFSLIIFSCRECAITHRRTILYISANAQTNYTVKWSKLCNMHSIWRAIAARPKEACFFALTLPKSNGFIDTSVCSIPFDHLHFLFRFEGWWRGGLRLAFAMNLSKVEVSSIGLMYLTQHACNGIDWFTHIGTLRAAVDYLVARAENYQVIAKGNNLKNC